MLLARVQGLECTCEEGREILHEAHARVLAGQCEWQEGLCRGGSCNQWLGEMKWALSARVKKGVKYRTRCMRASLLGSVNGRRDCVEVEAATNGWVK